MNVELVDFYAADGVLNDGYLAKTGSKKVLIATHGMTSNCFKNREKIIAKNLNENGIDFFVYNNRGSELVKYVKKRAEDGKEIKTLGGTSYEDPKEGYYDIKGAIEKMIDLGYQEIYLQGHSLGSTKTLYTYNRLKNEGYEDLDKIKAIVLLSLVNIPRALKIFLKEKYDETLDYAIQKEEKGLIYEMMPNGSFIHPLSVKTFLEYSKYSREIDFARYNDKEYNFEHLNNVEIPLFMRWGNNNEMIEESADDLVKLLNEKVNTKFKNIGYIDGADHGYSEKEENLAKEIVDFLLNIL